MGMITLDTRFVIEKPVNCDWSLAVNKSEPTFEIDLSRVYQAESRREELVTAHGNSLVELSNVFEESYDIVCRAHARVIYEEEMTTIASRKRRAILMRDEIPGIIKDRGLSTSRSPVGAADLRDTLYYEDEEFVSLEKYRAALGAVREFLFGKMMSLSRLCKQTEILLNRKDVKSQGLNDTDPMGDRYERAMSESMEKSLEDSNISVVTVNSNKKPAWGNKLKD